MKCRLPLLDGLAQKSSKRLIGDYRYKLFLDRIIIIGGDERHRFCGRHTRRHRDCYSARPANRGGALGPGSRLIWNR